MADRYATLGISVFTDATRNVAAITQANVEDLVDAITTALPGAHITWNLDDQALDDTSGSWGWLRSLIADRIANDGDAVAYWRKFGFPGTNAATENGLVDTYLPDTIALGGPPLISGWYIPNSTLEHARDTYNVMTAWGQVWSQHGVDGFSGDGSPNCPYFPSVNHAMVPAQAEANRLDVVMLDNLSVDLFGATTGGVRVTVDPLDAGTLTRQQQITASYLDAAYSPGPIRWINHHAQIEWLYTPANAASLTQYKNWLTWLGSTYADLQAVTVEEFGDAWRAAHPVNDFAIAHGQDDPAASGDAIYWLHTAKHRAAVKLTSGGTLTLLDLTRYSDDLVQPATPEQDVEIPFKVNQRDATHPVNPYVVAAYRELDGLLRSFPDLHSFAR